MYGVSETYSVYWENGAWHYYALPAQYLYASASIVDGAGTLYGSASGVNTTSSPSFTAIVMVDSSIIADGAVFLVTGYGAVYNWHSGSYVLGTYNYSVGIYDYYHHSNDSLTSLISNALRGTDVFMSGVHAYSITKSGETYGSILYERELGKPDWIIARATNGECGYIDVDDYWVPMPLRPADTSADYSVERVRTIPVYDEPGGTTVVGYFDMHYGGSSSEAA